MNPSATPKREGCSKTGAPPRQIPCGDEPPDENSLASSDSLRIMTVFGDAHDGPLFLIGYDVFGFRVPVWILVCLASSVAGGVVIGLTIDQEGRQ
jgi:hypothetical protein